jgi:hypothetical protein
MGDEHDVLEVYEDLKRFGLNATPEGGDGHIAMI